MEKEFVPYTLALEMKSIGFDEPCFGYYKEDKVWVPAPYHYGGTEYPYNSIWSYITAPTYSQAFRWFREKYNLICRVDVTSYGCPLNEQEFYCEITSKNGTASYEIFNTYEEAELTCLKKLIEIVKEKL